MVAEAVRRNRASGPKDVDVQQVVTEWLQFAPKDVDVQQAVTKWLQFARDREGEARMKKRPHPLSTLMEVNFDGVQWIRWTVISNISTLRNTVQQTIATLMIGPIILKESV